MRGVTYAAGAGLATLLIGPLAALALFAAGWARTPGQLGDVLFLLPIALFGSLSIGAFISLVPNVLGATAMGWMGTRWRWTRGPLVWGTAGALGGLALAGIFGARDLGAALFFVLSGATCALLCRRGTAWHD